MALFPILVCGLIAAQVLDVPFGRAVQLGSPGGRYTLIQERPGTAGKPASLFLMENASHRRTLVTTIDRAARAGWFPDGGAFFVEDQVSSDSSVAYIYKPGSTERIDVQARILASHPEVKNLFDGHAYLNVRRWKDSRHLVVALEGHTDHSPVTCFSVEFSVTDSGAVRELSERTGSPDARWCRF